MNKLSTMLEVAKPIFDALHDGMAVIDAEGIIRYVNEANTRITGMEPDKLVGRYVTDAVPFSRLLKTLRSGQAQTNVRTKVADREVLSNIVPLFVEGTCIGAVSIFRDITELRRLTEQLHIATETIRTIQVQTMEAEGILFGQHEKSKQVWRLAQRAALIPSTVLITGESGTGKEVLARYIHQHSERREKPFLAINCAAIPESLLESELFGYEEGAFTGAKKGGRPGLFEMADGGTLFLDEIGEMSIHLQAKLLRVLQDYRVKRVGGNKERQVDVRFIAATNRNLVELSQTGGFRQDLYYRLAVFPIEIPALREMKEEIEAFAQFFLDKARKKLGIEQMKLSKDAIVALQQYDFPGNLRELSNMLERAAALDDDGIIDAQDLLPNNHEVKDKGNLTIPLQTEAMTLAQLEKRYIANLAAHIPSKSQLAKRLGISRATLYRKLQEYGIVLNDEQMNDD